MSAAPDTHADGEVTRVPPHDLGAERAVISSLLLAPKEAFTEVQNELGPDDFYHPGHALLYRRMVSLHEEHKPVDLITLHALLDANKELERIGGPSYLAELADVAATAANVAHYARIVRDKALKRRLIGVATEIIQDGYADDQEAGEFLDSAEGRVLDIAKEQNRSTFKKVHDEIVGDTFDYLDMIKARSGEISGIATGFAKLDEITGGLQRGELLILAARPSMGKTAFALNIARNVAFGEHGPPRPVAVFSLEMTSRSLILRMLTADANVDAANMRRGFLSEDDYRRLHDAADRYSDAPLWIDDAGSLSILEIKAKCRRLDAELGGLDFLERTKLERSGEKVLAERDEKGLGLVIVDYLQLVRGEQRNHQRKDLEIADISRGLKALAKELQVPVLALSQLNRGPEQRDPDKRRPMMGDLRESGAIEQDADLVAFIYRDVVYNKEVDDPRKSEIIIEKQRNGPTGTVFLDFDNRFARFSNRTLREDEPHGAEASGRSFAGPEGGPPGTPDFGHAGDAEGGYEDF